MGETLVGSAASPPRSFGPATGDEVEAWVTAQLGTMDPRVKGSLDKGQLDEVRRLLRLSARIPGRFPVDLRFTVNLLITKVFVVFIVGRDRRRVERETATERRARLGQVVSSVASAGCFLILLLAFLGLLYLVKSWLGINIFPDAHLSDLFR
jgi:hypothetical protein